MKTLVKNSGGRWCIVEKELTCASPLVAYVPNQGWINGRVEYADEMGGYYFLNEEKIVRIPLSEKLEVRTVEEQEELIKECKNIAAGKFD